MPYPSKTSPQAIVAAAVAHLERAGLDRFSVRQVAASLGVAPNAVGRYYTGRDALLAAVADAAVALQLEAMRRAVARQTGAAAVRAAAAAYLAFARERPQLYRAAMTPFDRPLATPPAHHELWHQATAWLADLVGPERAGEAAVALWSYLHGAIGIEQAGLLSHPASRKPQDAIQYGLDAFLAGLSPA